MDPLAAENVAHQANFEKKNLLQATAWVKTYSEKANKAALAKQPIKAASPPKMATAAGAARRASPVGEPTKFGRGEWFDIFVEEYGDMINTKKLAEKVERKRLGLSDKKVKAAPTSSTSSWSTFIRSKGKKKTGGACGALPTLPPDDAYNLLITIWIAILIFSVTRYVEGGRKEVTT